MGMTGQVEGLVSYIDAMGPGTGQAWSDGGPATPKHVLLGGRQGYPGGAVTPTRGASLQEGRRLLHGIQPSLHLPMATKVFFSFFLPQGFE